jgi:hypothetical protein
MVPMIGLEPTIYRLQGGCIAIMLHGLKICQIFLSRMVSFTRGRMRELGHLHSPRVRFYSNCRGRGFYWWDCGDLHQSTPHFQIFSQRLTVRFTLAYYIWRLTLRRFPILVELRESHHASLSLVPTYHRLASYFRRFSILVSTTGFEPAHVALKGQ